MIEELTYSVVIEIETKNIDKQDQNSPDKKLTVFNSFMVYLVLSLPVVLVVSGSPSPVVTFSSFIFPKHKAWYAAIKENVLLIKIC